MKWFTYNQNNSGGYFVQDENVAEYIAVQAENAEKANEKAETITHDSAQDWCECCGERWWISADDNDGSDEPELYGIPVKEFVSEHYRKQIILHWADGKVERIVFPNPAPSSN